VACLTTLSVLWNFTQVTEETCENSAFECKICGSRCEPVSFPTHSSSVIPRTATPVTVKQWNCAGPALAGRNYSADGRLCCGTEQNGTVRTTCVMAINKQTESMSLTWVVVTWTLRDKCSGGGWRGSIRRGEDRGNAARGEQQACQLSRSTACISGRRFTIVFKKATILSPSLPPHSSVPYTGLVMLLRS